MLNFKLVNILRSIIQFLRVILMKKYLMNVFLLCKCNSYYALLTIIQ